MAGALCALSPGGDTQQKRTETFAQMIVGAELGLGPGASARGLYFVKGRIGMSADLMAGLARDEGWDFEIEHSDPPGKWCSITATREKSQPYKFKYTIEMAQAAGLSGANWKNYPWDMLYARGMAHVARKVAPARLLGLYTRDELMHIEPEDAQIIDVDTAALPASDPTAPIDKTEASRDPLLEHAMNGTQSNPTEGTEADQPATEHELNDAQHETVPPSDEDVWENPDE